MEEIEFTNNILRFIPGNFSGSVSEKWVRYISALSDEQFLQADSQAAFTKSTRRFGRY